MSLLRPCPIVAGLVLLTASCAADRVEPRPVAEPGCDDEARQLLAPVEVHSAPDAASSVVAVLQPGEHFVYLCDRFEGWRAIRYTRPPVDCSTRPEASRCPTGWVEQEPATEGFG